MLKSSKKLFITGSAGFIGFHLSKFFLEKGFLVSGFDGFTEYYDLNLKKSRHRQLLEFENFSFVEGMLENKKALSEALVKSEPNIVFHMAAQAGVRYSIENADAYSNSNFLGTFNLLEELKSSDLEHFIFASTSSVYGANNQLPFKENHSTDTPLSFYAATKKACEVMTFSYANLYNIPTTCVRFFTVYGPWGRPDMALFKFTKAILEERHIEVFNNGDLYRDFTFIDDLVIGLSKLMEKPPGGRLDLQNDTYINSNAPWRVVNLGNSSPKNLGYFIEILETSLNKKAKISYKEMQKGDLLKTYADVSFLKDLTGYVPKTNLEVGIKKFVKWYREYYDC